MPLSNQFIDPAMISASTIHRVQKARLIKASIRLNLPQGILVYKERCLYGVVVSPKSHGSPRSVIRTVMIWKINHVDETDRVPADPRQLFRDGNQRTVIVKYDLQRSLSGKNKLAVDMSQQLNAFCPAAFDAAMNTQRISKLLSAFLDQTVKKRFETSTILSRLAFETIVNARYLIANFSPELVNAFVRHSLRHERRLWDTIQTNIQGRGGEALHIEQRMLNSIERAARIAGITLDSVDLKNRSPWDGKDLRQKAQAVGLDGAYLAVFGGMSHNVHGSWHDLYQFHLETDGNGAFRTSNGVDRARNHCSRSVIWRLMP